MTFSNSIIDTNKTPVSRELSIEQIKLFRNHVVSLLESMIIDVSSGVVTPSDYFLAFSFAYMQDSEEFPCSARATTLGDMNYVCAAVSALVNDVCLEGGAFPCMGNKDDRVDSVLDGVREAIRTSVPHEKPKPN